jgi:hypothetical protein
MGIDYKQIFYRIKHLHPDLINEVYSPGIIESSAHVSDLYIMFCKMLIEYGKVKFDKRIIFIAVIMKMKDPKYFDFNDSKYSVCKLKGGFTTVFADVFNTTQDNVCHIFKNMKNYMTIYKEFRKEVDYFYRKMTE